MRVKGKYIYVPSIMVFFMVSIGSISYLIGDNGFSWYGIILSWVIASVLIIIWTFSTVHFLDFSPDKLIVSSLIENIFEIHYRDIKEVKICAQTTGYVIIINQNKIEFRNFSSKEIEIVKNQLSLQRISVSEYS